MASTCNIKSYSKTSCKPYTKNCMSSCPEKVYKYVETVSVLPTAGVLDKVYILSTDGYSQWVWNEDTDTFVSASGLVHNVTFTVTPTPNTPFVITHNLNSLNIILTAYDVLTGQEVSVVVANRNANSVYITSTTNETLDIVIDL